MHFCVGGETHDVREKAWMDVSMYVCELHLTDDWSVDITQVLSCARVIVGGDVGMASESVLDERSADITPVFSNARVIEGANTGMDGCLAVCKLPISDDRSADAANVFLFIRVIVEENTEIDSEKTVVT